MSKEKEREVELDWGQYCFLGVWMAFWAGAASSSFIIGPDKGQEPAVSRAVAIFFLSLLALASTAIISGAMKLKNAVDERNALKEKLNAKTTDS